MISWTNRFAPISLTKVMKFGNNPLSRVSEKVSNKTEILNVFLHTLQGLFWSFHFLIPFLNVKSQIFSPRQNKLSLPWKVLSTFGTKDSEAWRKLYWTLPFEKSQLKTVGTRSFLLIFLWNSRMIWDRECSGHTVTFWTKYWPCEC